jgi:steroid delta-isomerase-like uncharacterized protein
MSAESNSDLIERYFETIWNNGELDREPEFVADDVVVHGSPIQGVPAGRDGPLAIASMFRAAVPDLRLRNTVLMGDGDRVVQRWIVTGTHTGQPLFGIPPNGTILTVTGINEFRVEDGQIQEEWGVMDVLGMLQQLGAVPDPTHSQPPEK